MRVHFGAVVSQMDICDKAGPNIFRLTDGSLETSDNLPDPVVIAHEIVEDLEAALEQFREIVTDYGTKDGGKA